MIAKPCPKCRLAVSPMRPHVKGQGTGNLIHLNCYVEEEVAAAYKRGREDLLAEQANNRAMLEAAMKATNKAAADKKAIADAAAAIVAKEAAEKAAAIKTAVANLKTVDAGPAVDRFSLIELDDPAPVVPEVVVEVAALAPAPLPAYARPTPTDEEWVKAGSPCVRCKKPGPHGTYHPKHCSSCWMSSAPKHLAEANASTVPDKLPELKSTSAQYITD